jgi:5-methylcytosine-specific restriction endonuclease McrBC GTP-binding regulatory subunit McrB
MKEKKDMGEKLNGNFTIKITGLKQNGPDNSRYYGVIINGQDREYGRDTQVTLKMQNDKQLPEDRREDFYSGKTGEFNGKHNDIQTAEGSVALGRGGEDFPNPFIRTIEGENMLTESEMQLSIQDYIDLLKSNHNLILTGAPGTGKTYLAKQIAMRVIFDSKPEKASLDPDKLEGEDKKLFVERFDFVQFHPSYDYTDFVEGLRPKEDEKGNVGFELRDGVFKEFCKRAIKAQKSGAPSVFDDTWEKFIKILDEHSPLKIEEGFSVRLTPRGSIRDTDPNYGSYTKQNIYNVYRGLKGRKSGAFDYRMKKILGYLEINFNLSDYVEKEQKAPDAAPPYIFVIDEINRGEISKIFGELFFSVDPGYRGKKGKVETQYANIQSDETIFDEEEGPGWFYIPENVYIIGTMNDIDRSVDSFDFAMRRRFVWKEITAMDSAVNMKLKEKMGDDVIARMKSLNEEIASIDGLGQHYQIGAAYFLKLEKYKLPDSRYDYEKLWQLHLEPLLHEYVRALPEPENKLGELKKAYSPKDKNVS